MKRFAGYLLLLSVVSVFTASCEEAELETNQYAIKSEVVNGLITARFEYNQQGNIAEWQGLHHYARYLYDDERRLVRSESAIDPATLSSGTYVEKTTLMTSENTTITGYQTYGYDAEGRLIEIENYTHKDGDFVLTSTHSLEYEGEYIAKRNIHNEDGRITQFRTYEYDDQGNVKQEKYYSLIWTDEPSLLSETIYEYDDKNNPFAVFRALGNPGLFTNPNNIISSYTVQYDDVSGIQESSTTTRYAYNQRNYPVKVISGNSEFAYTY
jgi:hypothetical protein